MQDRKWDVRMEVELWVWRAKECGQALETEEDKEMGYPWEPEEGLACGQPRFDFRPPELKDNRGLLL